MMQAPPSLGWRRLSSSSQAVTGGARLHDLTAASAAGTVQVRLVEFDTRRHVLRVMNQPDSRAGGGVISAVMRHTGAVAGVNGGFFHPDFQPLGLVIAGGQRHGSFARTGLISGSYVLVNREPYLVWNQEFLGEKGVSDLLQAGPRLLDGGRPVGGLNATKNAARTFVATDGGRVWVLGVVRGTSLAGLADLLATPGVLPVEGLKRALNLDGGRSTAFYARLASGQEIAEPGWSTVRNYLALVPR